MKINLEKAGKHFNREWIFRNLSYQFEQGKHCAITGANGSGKSTLLQAIAGAISLNEGKIIYQKEKEISPERIFNFFTLAAPSIELPEEMTAKEFLHFHKTFKPFIQNISCEEILQATGLIAAADKQIRFFSSGMKQRIKLAQAIFAAAPILLLDEPCTNLDEAGIALYHALIKNYCREK